jgi:hypothetical protein
MVQVAPNLYRKYITVDRKGMTILYVKMQKALYGLLRSALLFYNKLMADLEGDGFMLNPYDLCVANKVVDGKQMTVCWHVDNLKVSHCDPAQVTFFGEWLSEKYGVAVATHLGKVHDYLGMIFDFSPKGKVMVTFDLRFLAKRKGNGYHDGHQEYHKGLPGGDHRDKDIPCRGPSVRSERSIPGKGVAKRAGDGIPLYNGAASVLECKGAAGHSASHCFSDHASKVAGQRRLWQGQEGTDLSEGYSAHAPPLILSTDLLTLSRWWVDAAYTVHGDCQGHTGTGMNFGQGMALRYSGNI